MIPFPSSKLRISLDRFLDGQCSFIPSYMGAAPKSLGVMTDVRISETERLTKVEVFEITSFNDSSSIDPELKQFLDFSSCSLRERKPKKNFSEDEPMSRKINEKIAQAKGKTSSRESTLKRDKKEKQHRPKNISVEGPSEQQ